MSFLANARVMLGGFAIAQFLPILVAPLLTRLYAPEAFGLLTLFMSCLSVLVVLATLRLDLALVMTDQREDAKSLVAIVLFNTALIAVALIIVLSVFGGKISGWLTDQGSTFWLWMLVPATAGAAIAQMCMGLLSRDREFKKVASGNVLNQVTYVLVAIALGATLAPQVGLVTARLAGQIGLALFAVVVCWSMLSGISRTDLKVREGLWDRNKQFVIYNTPYSLIGSIAREMPIYVFVATASTAAAGFYGLARTILLVPSLLMSASLSQVFYREAVDLRGTKALEVKASALLTFSLCIFTPLFAFICTWGDHAFAFVFGEQWHTAGTYAMVLAPAAWLSVQSAWPERLFEVYQRQDASFRIQIIFDILTAAAVVLAMVLLSDPLYVIAAFAVVNCAYHLVYLNALASISGFDLPQLRRKILTGAVLFAAGAAGLYAVRNLAGDTLPLMLASGIACASIALLLGIMHFRRVMLAMEAKAGI